VIGLDYGLFVLGFVGFVGFVGFDYDLGTMSFLDRSCHFSLRLMKFPVAELIE
jgi:hypothetical protein